MVDKEKSDAYSRIIAGVYSSPVFGKWEAEFRDEAVPISYFCTTAKLRWIVNSIYF